MIQLDVLRGIAILLVLFNHSVTDRDTAGWLTPAAQFLGRGGWTGVDLFFVLSGFLVGGLLLAELRTRGTLDIRRFIIRRGFKIWPSYYLLVLVCIILDGLHTGWFASLRMYLPNLLHVQNYAGRLDRDDHTWSLAVEEHFYLALPLLLWALTFRGRRRGRVNALPWIALLVIAACNTARFVLNWHTKFRARTHSKPTELRIDSLAFGVLLAYLYHFRPAFLEKIARRRWTLLLCGLALVAPMGILSRPDHPFIWTIGYTMLYVGYGCILVAAVHTPLGKAGGIWGRFFASPFARVLATIGIYSYSIYLWHFDFVHTTMEQKIAPMIPLHGSLKWITATGIYIFVAFVVGFVLAKLVELPALALRDRYFPGKSTALVRTDATNPGAIVTKT